MKTAQQEEQRSFTQEDVNRIVTERLAKERAKSDTAFAEKEKELTEREFRMEARKVLEGAGLSADLLGVIRADTLEELESALGLLDEEFNYSNPNKVVMPPSGQADAPKDDGIRRAMGLK